MAREIEVLNVEGMSCSHCENSVIKSVSSLEGVGKVSVDLKAKTVTVEYDSDGAGLDLIKETIEDQGYDVR